MFACRFQEVKTFKERNGLPEWGGYKLRTHSEIIAVFYFKRVDECHSILCMWGIASKMISNPEPSPYVAHIEPEPWASFGPLLH
jgi:hypothetical protein